MTDRVRIRVSMNGKEPDYDLMVEGTRVMPLTWDQIADITTDLNDWLRKMLPHYEFRIGDGLIATLSWIEALEFCMQGLSSLRYIERPTTR